MPEGFIWRIYIGMAKTHIWKALQWVSKSHPVDHTKVSKTPDKVYMLTKGHTAYPSHLENDFHLVTKSTSFN